jgi:tetratricopeptide (TPR) repeat protein
LDVLDQEHQNLRAALVWSFEGRGELGLRLVGSLWRFWLIHGHLTEGRRWLDAVLDLTEGHEEVSLLRARALNGAGNLARGQGDYDGARALFEESLRIRQDLGYKQGMMYTLGNLGLLAAEEGDYERAGELQAESLRLSRELENTRGMAHSLSSLGILAERQCEYERARELQEEALRLSRQLGTPGLVAMSLNNLGVLAERQGEYERAQQLHEEALRLSWLLGDKLGIAAALVGLATVAGSRQEHARATQLLGAVDTVWTSTEAAPAALDRERVESVSRDSRVALRFEVYEAAWNQGRAMNLKEAVTYALVESG